MKRILILIPHPDDEIVGVSIIIRRMLKKGCSVFLFFLTNGVVDSRDMWFWERKNYKKYVAKRIREMDKSIKFLNVNEFYLQNIPTRRLKNFILPTVKKIKEIIMNNRIDSIFTTAYEGGHQDHDISNFIASKFKSEYDVYEFPEYNYYGKVIRSNSFIQNHGNEKIIKLSNDEIRLKKQAMKIYESEKSNLSYLEIKQECYRPIIDYNYSMEPHIGTLFYRRYRFFSWHPKVDSTNPSKVCKIINEHR